ncbi:hypothetical protein ACSVDA_01135 [Cytobacillus sp. Hm23]
MMLVLDTILLILLIGLTVFHYNKTKKLIQISVTLVYPTPKDLQQHGMLVDGMIITNHSFASRQWKIIKWTTFSMTLILTTVLVLGYINNLSIVEAFPNFFLLTILVTWNGDRSIFTVLQEGMLVKGKVYKWEQFNYFKVTRMSRWHEYAGIHDKIKEGFEVKLHIINASKIRPVSIVIDKAQIDNVKFYLLNAGLKEIDDTNL